MWLAGAPDHVLDIFHDKETGLWTVFYTGVLLNPPHSRTYSSTTVSGRDMDRDPFHPQGVGMFFTMPAYEVVLYRYRNGHKRVTWESLPEKVKKCVHKDAKP